MTACVRMLSLLLLISASILGYAQGSIPPGGDGYGTSSANYVLPGLGINKGRVFARITGFSPYSDTNRRFFSGTAAEFLILASSGLDDADRGQYWATYVTELNLTIGGQQVDLAPPPGVPASGPVMSHHESSWSHTVRFASPHFQNGPCPIKATAKVLYFRTIPSQDPNQPGGTTSSVEKEIDVEVLGEIYNKAVIWRTLTAADLEIDETPDTNSYISVSGNGAEQAATMLSAQNYLNLRGTIVRSKYDICGQTNNQSVADVPNDLYNATLLFAFTHGQTDHGRLYDSGAIPDTRAVAVRAYQEFGDAIDSKSSGAPALGGTATSWRPPLTIAFHYACLTMASTNEWLNGYRLPNWDKPNHAVMGFEALVWSMLFEGETDDPLIKPENEFPQTKLSAHSMRVLEEAENKFLSEAIFIANEALLPRRPEKIHSDQVAWHAVPLVIKGDGQTMLKRVYTQNFPTPITTQSDWYITKSNTVTL